MSMSRGFVDGVESLLFRRLWEHPQNRHFIDCKIKDLIEMGWKSPVAFERKVAQTSTWGGTKARQVQNDLIAPEDKSIIHSMIHVVDCVGPADLSP